MTFDEWWNVCEKMEGDLKYRCRVTWTEAQLAARPEGGTIVQAADVLSEGAWAQFHAMRAELDKRPRPEPEPHSYALLKLEGAAKPLFFVMEERYGSRDEDEYESHRKYFYEEHSCPTNWLRNCLAVIEEGDTDPHGFLTYVRSVPIQAGQELDINSEPLWNEIFPEAFEPSSPPKSS